MALADRDLVDADHHPCRRSSLGQLSAHVLLVELLDRVPVQLQLFCNIADRRAAAAPADIKRKPLSVERIVRQEFQSLALHLAAMPAPDAPHLELQKYAQAAGRKIPNAPKLAIVPSGMLSPAYAATGFFERRTSVTIRACRSPNTPRTCSSGRKPANRYASRNRRRFAAVTKILPPTLPVPRLWNHLRFANEIRAPVKIQKAAIHRPFAVEFA